MSQPRCTCDSNAPTHGGPKARVPSQLHSQLCLHMCSTSHSAPAASAHVPLPICSFMPTDCKNEWRWHDLFSNPFIQPPCRNSPQNKNTPHIHRSTPAWFGGWSGSCFSCRTSACLAASCCSGWALLSPTPSRVTGKESLCNKCPSITRTLHCRGVFTSSPVPRVVPCFPTCHVPPHPHELSVGSEQDPHWQPRAGQPQLAASSLLLFLCQLASWHQSGEHNCCLSIPAAQTNNRQAPVSPISGLCLWHCLPLGSDTRLVGHLPWANGNCGH